MIIPNVKLMDETLDHIKTLVKGDQFTTQIYDPMVWAFEGKCGTAHCFGGWGLVLDGWEFQNVPNLPGSQHALQVRRTPGSPWIDVLHGAALAFNIDADEAYNDDYSEESEDPDHGIFFDTNTIDDLERYVEMYRVRAHWMEDQNVRSWAGTP